MADRKPTERVIEYEVEGHPWASEEGCALCAAELGEPGTSVVVRMSHEEAAAERAKLLPFEGAGL